MFNPPYCFTSQGAPTITMFLHSSFYFTKSNSGTLTCRSFHLNYWIFRVNKHFINIWKFYFIVLSTSSFFHVRFILLFPFILFLVRRRSVGPTVRRRIVRILVFWQPTSTAGSASEQFPESACQLKVSWFYISLTQTWPKLAG